jgi:hypothetical protein
MILVKKKRRFNVSLVVYSLILVVISITIFSVLLDRQDSDIRAHNEMSLRRWGIEVFSHPFYFALLSLFSGFTPDIDAVNTTSIVLLSAAIVARFLVLNFLLTKLVSGPGHKYRPWILSAIAFSLCIVHAIPYRRATLMLGLFTPTIWHNSTIIFLVPMALLLFWYSYQILIQPSIKKIIVVAGLVVVSILTKPNFFLCFAPAFGLFLMSKYRLSFSREFWLCLLPVIAGAFILTGEYWIVTFVGKGEGVKVGLFLVWNHFTDVKWLSFLFSFTFPLSYAVFHFSSVRNDKLLVYSWLIAFLGLVIYSLLYEPGFRMFHANFIWQMVPALLILYLCTVANFLNSIKNRLKTLLTPKYLIVLGVFALHFIAGCVYIYKVVTIDIW